MLRFKVYLTGEEPAAPSAPEAGSSATGITQEQPQQAGAPVKQKNR